jgi:hypothetical protein
MGKLTPEQVAGVVTGIGPPAGTTVAQWVAKSRQESGHNPEIQDFLSSGHWGLWQIWEDHFGSPGMPGASSKSAFVVALKIPQLNFQAAKALYQRDGWAPWRASGGKPTPNPTDERAAANPDKSINASGGGGVLPDNPLDALNPVDEIQAALQPFTAIIDPIVSAAEWLGNPANWMRIVQVGGGVVIGIVALGIALKPVTEEVAKTVKGLKPI